MMLLDSLHLIDLVHSIRNVQGTHFLLPNTKETKHYPSRALPNSSIYYREQNQKESSVLLENNFMILTLMLKGFAGDLP